jgi:hypothetical protein
VTAELKAPMTEELVRANVMRPRIPLVYPDLNTIIYIARALRGDTTVPEAKSTCTRPPCSRSPNNGPCSR